jgi:hypothetical protein
MPYRFFERPGTRQASFNPPCETREYGIEGIDDPVAVKLLALQETAYYVSTVQGILYRQDLQIKEVGNSLYYITVPYAEKQNQSGQYSISFDTTGGTTHISASKSTAKIYDGDNPAGALPAVAVKHNYKQLIGYNGEDVEGTDVIIPAGKFTVEFKHPLGVVDTGYMQYVFDLIGKVNSAPFAGFPAGEVLFTGCRGSSGSETEATLSYEFAREKNVEDLVIGPYTIDKLGWQYAWIRRKDDVAGTLPLKVPEAVIVENVYESADLAGLLGFG